MTIPIPYAGIGSRTTPIHICNEMSNIAMQLALRNFVLRSGRAKRPFNNPPEGTDSADLVFERGCDLVGGLKFIRVPTMYQKALEHAEKYHPNWSACDDHAKALHARNSLIMMGDGLDSPVKFVVCWTPDGKVTGGTGQALRIAAANKIPIVNLATVSAQQFWEWFAQNGF